VTVGNDALPGMFAVFIDAQSGDGTQRVQWLLVPPSVQKLTGVAGDHGRFIKRRFDRKGHKPKWATSKLTSAAATSQYLKSNMREFESTGWVFRPPVVIRLETDDYQDVWRGKTPYKALRHVEAVTRKRGYRIVH
jgi:hypothetical protein